MAASLSTRTRAGTLATSSASATTANSGASCGSSLRTCVGCGGQIHDQFILCVAPNLEWHAKCLKCCQCQKFLDENCTCFVRDGKIFCKEDYVRLFGSKCGTKCEKCTRYFGASDLVMRARNKIFHLECFRCVACDKQLVPGDEYALRPDGLFCKADHASHDAAAASSSFSLREENNNNDQTDDLEEDDEQSQDGEKDLLLDERHDRFADSGMDDLGSEKSPCSSVGGVSSSMSGDLGNGGQAGSAKGGHQQRRSRAGRVRTVLTEKQLSLLKSCYQANPRPDALMKEQLVEMTGLSPRVVRVWFQNKRCKDKKKMCLQKSKEGRKLGYSGMPGVPMVATSPMRHDLSAISPSSGGQPIHPVDVHSYEPPWKALCDFALHSDLERPGFNHLVGEMHGYDYGRGDQHYPMPPIEGGGECPPPPYMETAPGPPPPPPSSVPMDGYTLTSLDSASES